MHNQLNVTSALQEGANQTRFMALEVAINSQYIACKCITKV